MPSLTEENYLKALFTLSDGEDKVSVKRLAEVLSIKMPTVTSMMKRLSEKGLVHYESYKPLSLTPAGRKQAALIIRRHRLTEMFLVEKMGFGWEEVHQIAEEVEHVHVPAFFEKMDELLDYPKVDPHGSPIPDKDGNIAHPHYVALSDCQTGDTFTLRAVNQAQDDFLAFLNDRKLCLGVQLAILLVEPFDQSIKVQYESDGSHTETLSQPVSQRLLGERQPAKKS